MRNKRRDGKRIRGLDGYHNILPYVMPKRTEAEVSLTEQFDVTDLVKYKDLSCHGDSYSQDCIPQAEAELVHIGQDLL